MRLNMPKLEEGRVYRRAEVESYIGLQTGTSDFDVVDLHFPRHLETWQHDGRGWRDGEEMLLQYQVFPMAEFKPQLWELADTFSRHEEHQGRVEAIVEVLTSGKPVFPVFLQQNDPQRRIIEGMHRAVALFHLGSPCLPAFLTGYLNWFTLDGALPEFEREDEIVPASLQDVYGLFMRAICIDHKGIELALFGSDRLRLCDEAFVAKHDGRIIGAVTMTVAKGKPTLSTVYVLRQYRQRGVAFRLCEKALLRFQQVGIGDVFCEVMSPGMEATLRRLSLHRPELRAIVKEKIAYLPGEDIEIGLDEDLLGSEG